jgi:hypothetical protein
MRESVTCVDQDFCHPEVRILGEPKDLGKVHRPFVAEDAPQDDKNNCRLKYAYCALAT